MADISKIVTLTTDFSTEDGYVGAMKGRILSIAPQANIHDITHHIEPQNILMASWCIFRSSRHFPANSIHVVVVDPGVGSERSPLLIRADQQWYIGPDNGVFTEIIKHSEEIEIYRIHRETPYWNKHQSFDGLEIFAPVAAHLMNGRKLKELGEPTDKVIMLPNARMKKGDDFIEGEVIMFDKFGNAVSNIRQEDLAKLPPQTTVCCHNHLFKFVTHYLEGKENCPIALVNSDKLVELSVYCGSAKDRFALKIGEKVRIS